ncbi:hypothetical protein KIM322_09130 [Lactobacillus xylocopicola]|uniref:Uncharacterized protein n=1 Tax=Lactobacillus xylocopicola TaxID=2976676 RepID=A0ABM8BHB9_9LACO|nr:hypothetical protein KIM322_09130 [Lactobacillus xylocopicola]
MAELFLTDFDQNPRAVLEPNHEQAELGYQFQPKLLFAFTSSESIAIFLKTHAHCLRGYFDSFGGKIPIYEVELNQEKITFCQAKLGLLQLQCCLIG